MPSNWKPRLRLAYMLLSVPLIVWLLAANLDLRYYRETSLALDINQITAGLKGATQEIDRALETYDQKLHHAAIDWLATAERDLTRVETAARGYSAALNRRFSSVHGTFELGTVAGIYAQETRSVRQYLTHHGELRPEDRALLADIAADLRTLQEALPEELLQRARLHEVGPLIRELGRSLKVKSVRGWLGV